MTDFNHDCKRNGDDDCETCDMIEAKYEEISGTRCDHRCCGIGVIFCNYYCPHERNCNDAYTCPRVAAWWESDQPTYDEATVDSKLLEMKEGER